jgi:hypothetical protein
VRHGQAHQSQQIMVTTSDNRTFGVSLSGVTRGRTLDTVFAQGRPPNHLAVLSDPHSGDVMVVLQPEVLFLDLEKATAEAGVFARGLPLKHPERPRKAGDYAFRASAAEQALRGAGHPPFSSPQRPEPPPERRRMVRQRVGRLLIRAGKWLGG